MTRNLLDLIFKLLISNINHIIRTKGSELRNSYNLTELIQEELFMSAHILHMKDLLVKPRDEFRTKIIGKDSRVWEFLLEYDQNVINALKVW